MSIVQCAGPCGRQVPENEARRELVVRARTGKGGTLSDVKRIKPTGRYFCDSCTRAEEHGDMAPLFGEGRSA